MNSKSTSATDCFDGPLPELSSLDLSFRTDVQEGSGLAELLREYDQDSPTEAKDSDASLLYHALALHRTDDSAPPESESMLAEKAHCSTIVKAVKPIGNFLPGGSGSGRLILPHINDEIFGFRLLHELGRGGFAKVFLAQQGELANRQMVLKISAIEGTEPQTLAQMQHTHVVPIYSVHEDIHTGLRAVCMPYLGGACLAKVIDKAWENQATPTTGRALLEALDRVAGPHVARYRKPASQQTAPATIPDNNELHLEHTPRVQLAGLSFVQAAAWIVERLAEGLQHSHERNVIHRDIKPSNILLSEEGQPLLLDFNVSQEQLCNPADASVGGTVPYMAPEQLRATVEVAQNGDTAATPQADIYSLGLVLYELLSGQAPFVKGHNGPLSSRPWDELLKEREQPVPSLKARSTLQIPWSLESIVRKCLEVEPAKRYTSAANLAEDLSRFLNDQPLKFAPELSRVEQIQKWGRRHPRLTTAGMVTMFAAMLIVPGAVILHFTQDDLAIQRSLLTDARAEQSARDFQTLALSALCIVDTVIETDDTRQEGIAACKVALAIYQSDQNPEWQQRPVWSRLPLRDRPAVTETMREVLMSLASAQVRTSQPKPADIHESLRLLDIAESLPDLPPSKALWLDRARYQSLLNLEEKSRQSLAKAETIPATTAHDLYMLATAHTHRDTPEDYREAVRLLDRSIALAPNHYWSYFRRALCQHKLHEPLLAAADIGTSIGRWPESPYAHFNRGYFLDEQERNAAAVDSYTAAIKYAPTFIAPYFNRGLARLELRDYTGARDDFLKVRELGRHDAVVDAGLAMAYEGLGRHADADQLFDRALQPSQGTEPLTLQRLTWTYAFAVSHRAPEVAERAFDDVLKQDRQQREALYGKGMLRMQAGQLRDAVTWFDAAINADANFIEPLRYRAISLARLGDLEQAVADANLCISKESNHPDSLYVAACVAAISARRLKSEDLSKNALTLLQRAITCGTPHDRAADDPDFSYLKGDADFQKIVAPHKPPALHTKPSL